MAISRKYVTGRFAFIIDEIGSKTPKFAAYHYISNIKEKCITTKWLITLPLMFILDFGEYLENKHDGMSF